MRVRLHVPVFVYDTAGTITYSVTDLNNPSAHDSFSLSKGNLPSSSPTEQFGITHKASIFTEFHGPTAVTDLGKTGPYNVQGTNPTVIDGNKRQTNFTPTLVSPSPSGAPIVNPQPSVNPNF